MSKAHETAKEMAKLTMLTNQLNEVQLKNLKTYPFIFFDGLQEVTMEYDLSNQLAVDTEEDRSELNIDYKFNATTDHLRVTYRLVIDKTIPQTHMQTRYDHLEAAVRNLLWKDIKVEVYINGDKSFESKK